MTNPVGTWMTRDVMTTSPDEPLFSGVELMANNGIRHIVVLDGERLCGMLSNRDIIRATGMSGDKTLDLQETLVRDVMTTIPLETTSPFTPLEDAAGHMLRTKVNALPVLDVDGRLAGILTTDDVLAAVARGARAIARPDV